MNDDSIHQFLRDAAEPDLDEKALESALDAAAADSPPLSEETITRMLSAASAPKAPTKPKTTHWSIWLYSTAAAAAAITIAFLWPQQTTPKPGIENRELITTNHERRVERLKDDSLLYLDENTRVTISSAREIKLEAGRAYVEVARQVDAAGKRIPFTMQTPQGPVVALGTKFAVDLNGGKPEVLVTEGKVTATGLAQPLLAGQWWRGSGVETAPQAVHGLGWTRELRMLIAPPPVPPSQDLGGALRSADGSAVFTLRRCHVDVHVEDGMARTTIDQTYFNHLPSRQEGTFYFPLPPDASISRLAMYVNGKLMEGGMAEREEARRTFETIKHKMQDPALLEWVDGSTFKMRVFPLEGREEKRIVISYVQKLDTLHGRSTLRVPLGHSLGKTGQWSFLTRIKDGRDAAWRSLHHDLTAAQEGTDLLLSTDKTSDRMQRDVVLEIATPPSTSPRLSSFDHEGARYLALRWTPDLPAAPPPAARHWLFLIETSADRDRILAQTQREVLRGILDQASADDSFEIVTASTRTTALEPKQAITAANRDAALKKLENEPHLGALDLGKAFETLEREYGEAYSPVANAAPKSGEWSAIHSRSNKPTLIVHLGSATPILGETDNAKLLAQLPKGCVYASIGIGKRWNLAFARAAAAQTGGWFTRINPDESPGWRAFEFLSAMNAARLVDLKLDGADWRLMSETLAHGTELCAVAKLPKDAPLPTQIRVSGTLGGQPWLRDLKLDAQPNNAGWLPRAWAKLELDRLAAAGADKHRAEIVALSKSSYVMSPFTSLLVLENDAMYEQYKIDRGRKDHWAMYPCPEIIPVVKEPLNDTSKAETDSRSPKDVEQRVQEALRTLEDVPGGWDDYGVVFRSAGLILGTGSSFVDMSESITRLDRFAPATFTGTISGSSGSETIGYRYFSLSGRGIGGDWPSSGRFGSRSYFQNMGAVSSAPQLLTIGGTLDMNGLNNYTGDTTINGGTLQFGTVSALTKAGAGTLTLTGTNTYTGGTTVSAGTLMVDNNDFITLPGNGTVTPLPWKAYDVSGNTLSLGSGGVLGGSVVEFDGYIADAGLKRGNSTLFDYSLPEHQVRGVTQRMAALRAGFEVPGMLTDLTLYADGFMTTMTDRFSVAEEAFGVKTGQIDPAARALVDAARARPAMSVVDCFNDRWLLAADGRALHDKRNAWSLQEIISYDGTTQRHLYPEIGLGTERAMTRARWAELRARFPWLLPPADLLARDAEVKKTAERTIQIIPHDENAPVTALIFGPEGELAEIWLLEPKTGRRLQLIQFSRTGHLLIMIVKNAEGRETRIRQWKTGLIEPARLQHGLDLASLVILPMPARRSASQNTLEWLASCWLTDRARIPDLINTHFHAKGDKRPGLDVLAACGVEELFRGKRGSGTADIIDRSMKLMSALHMKNWTRTQGIPASINLFEVELSAYRKIWALIEMRNSKSDKEILEPVLEYGWRDGSAMLRRIALQKARATIQSPDLDKCMSAALDRQRHLTGDWRLDAVCAAEWLEQGDVKRATEVFTKWIENSIQHDVLSLPPEAFQRAFERAKQEDKARALVDRAVAHLIARERHVAALQFAAATLRGDALIEAVRGITAVDLKDGTAWVIAAELYAAQSRAQEAVACLRKALRAGLPDESHALGRLVQFQAYLSDARKKLGVDFAASDRDEVRAAALKLMQTADPAPLSRQLASQLDMLDLRDLAHDLRTTSLALKPNETQPWIDYASDCGTSNRIEEALTAYERAFAAEGTNAQTLLTHAQFLENQRRPAEARKLYQKIADGTWGPNYNWVVQQAKQKLERK